jgi:GntR family transcriptional regulator
MKFLAFLSFKNAKSTIDKFKIKCYSTDRTDNTDNTDERRGKMPKGLFGKRDVYIEVAEKYENYIRLGVLRDGDKLPSVRTAAAELGVNPNTVQKAYVLLEEKGLICSLPKKGAFVTYSGDASGNIFDTRRANAVKTVHELKEQGITLDELNEIIREVFSND